MFAGIPSVPTSSQQLTRRSPPGAISTVWSVPVCSSGIISGNSYVESQQIDPFGGQFGQSSPQRPINSLEFWIATVWGAVCPFITPSGRTTIREFTTKFRLYWNYISGWVPILPQQPRVVYSMQQCVPVSNIPLHQLL
jgi:hypothetical protein